MVFIIRFILVLHQNVSLVNLNSFHLAICSSKANASACWIISESIWADTIELRMRLVCFLRMDEFFDWCRKQAVLPGSKLGTTLEYSLKYESTFRTVLSDGNLVLSNNLAERAIKTFVIGRKNWLFFQSFEGAKSTAIILSLLETAKRHGLDSEKYMTYLLDHLPNEERLAKREILEAYLPWAETIQEKCK